MDEQKQIVWNKHLAMTPEHMFVMCVITDGTVTRAQLTIEGHAVAVGEARRMKQDARNPHLGSALAMSRCLMEASEFYAHHAQRFMNPPTAPAAHRETVRRRKEARKAIRDNRRKAAREAYAEAKKSDPDTWVELFNAQESDRNPDEETEVGK